MKPWPLGILFGVTLVLLLTCPWLLVSAGAGRLPLLAGLIAWRSLATLGLWGLGITVMLVGLIGRLRRFALALSLPVLLAALVVTGVAASSSLRAVPQPDAAGRTITLLSWNINGSLVTAETLAREVDRHDADVLVLPSIDSEELDAVSRLLAPGGYTLVDAADSGTAIISRVGYRLANSDQLGRVASGETIATASGLPLLIAVHLPIPLLPANNTIWNSEVDRLGDLCQADDGDGLVIMGDFNATLDNLAASALGTDCRDAAAQTGTTENGSWPTQLMPALAMPIDHTFVSGDIAVRDFAVLTDQDDSGALHRPILASITTPSSH